MSLITRCPACGTMFKVVPDQLRISEGWVRCGHCADIFDATANLQAGATVPLPPEMPQVGAAEAHADSLPVADEQADRAAPESFSPPVAVPVPEAEPEPASESAPVPAPAAPSAPEAGPARPVSLPISRFDGDNPDSIAAPPLYPWFPSEVHDSQVERDSQFQRELGDAEPDLDDVPFVKAARRKAWWRRPLVRTLLLVLLVALGAALAGQYAFLERDRLAAQVPALRPWLAQMCEALRCELRPPRQIDAVVIDSSSFTKLRGDVFRLNYVLRNQGRLPLAMPAIELTLTDSQDQPLIRRVLMPSEVGVEAVIAPAAESNGSLSIAVAGSGARIAGYRLLAFYP